MWKIPAPSPHRGTPGKSIAVLSPGLQSPPTHSIRSLPPRWLAQFSRRAAPRIPTGCLAPKAPCRSRKRKSPISDLPAEMGDFDVPSPIDFHDPAQAKSWEQNTIVRRPWRPEFFQAFASELNSRFSQPFSVLELGSGPGHLAQQILSACQVARYCALDFSDAMHALACERLGPFAAKVEFVI